MVFHEDIFPFCSQSPHSPSITPLNPNPDDTPSTSTPHVQSLVQFSLQPSSTFTSSPSTSSPPSSSSPSSPSVPPHHPQPSPSSTVASSPPAPLSSSTLSLPSIPSTNARHSQRSRVPPVWHKDYMVGSSKSLSQAVMTTHSQVPSS